MKRKEVVTVIVAAGVLTFLFGWLWKKSKVEPLPGWTPPAVPPPPYQPPAPQPVITPPAQQRTDTTAYWNGLAQDALNRMTDANQERIVYSSIDPVRAKAALDRYVIWREKYGQYAAKEREAYNREHGVG